MEKDLIIKFQNHLILSIKPEGSNFFWLLGGYRKTSDPSQLPVPNKSVLSYLQPLRQFVQCKKKKKKKITTEPTLHKEENTAQEYRAKKKKPLNAQRSTLI